MQIIGWKLQITGSRRIEFFTRGFRRGGVGLACIGLTGCTLRGAPSYSIFGAYFPAWLLCAGFGIFGSILLRSLLIATELEEAVPLKLLVYCAFALGLCLWLWLALFGES